jgi:hypothetical protein
MSGLNLNFSIRQSIISLDFSSIFSPFNPLWSIYDEIRWKNAWSLKILKKINFLISNGNRWFSYYKFWRPCGVEIGGSWEEVNETGSRENISTSFMSLCWFKVSKHQVSYYKIRLLLHILNKFLKIDYLHNIIVTVLCIDDSRIYGEY